MSKNKKDDENEHPIVAKTPVDLQRLKLMKLMKNPDKPIQLPDRPKSKTTPAVPEFVRNVMGSSAGAGSGEFHVYRHLRRKEYARQKFIQEKNRKEILDSEYQQKLENNKILAAERTAKKRAKRLKKKLKSKKDKVEKDDKNIKTSLESQEQTDDSDEDETSERSDEAITINNEEEKKMNI